MHWLNRQLVSFVIYSFLSIRPGYMAAFHFRMANNTNLFKYFLLQQNENGQFKRAIQEKFFKTGFSFITSISQQKQ
jgi:translation elongation factor EF-1alpha